SLFIDAANAWEACPNPEARHHAIEILQTGIHRIGPLHELYRELVHHYLTTQDYDEAITSQTYLVEHAVHPIMPLMERAWIYEKAGDPGSAKADLHQALNLLNDLPPSKSGLPAMMKLRDDIMAGLTRLPK
ncbi:MAG TPA: hypothetical protein VJ508_04830, partial [Saprospiraceae bacterium]|nr:hypothetical protein [Saprospiraceae bacterium]